MNFRIQCLAACLVTTLSLGCAATVKPSVKLSPAQEKDLRGCLTEWHSLDKDPKTPLPRIAWVEWADDSHDSWDYLLLVDAGKSVLITELDPDDDHYCVVMTEESSVSAAFGRDGSTRKISLMTGTSKKRTHSQFVLWSKNAEGQPASIDATPCNDPEFSTVRLLKTGPVFLQTKCRSADGNDDVIIHETGFYGVAKKKLIDLLSVVTKFSVKNDDSEEDEDDEGDEDDEEDEVPDECYETVNGWLKIIQKAGQFIVRAAQPICPDRGFWDCKLDGSATLSEWTIDPKTFKMKKLSSKPLKLKPVSDCED